jgi:hypothetical protein
MIDSFSRTMARISEIEARIRYFDPSRGAMSMPASMASAQASSAASPFAATLASVASGPATARPVAAAPVPAPAPAPVAAPGVAGAAARFVDPLPGAEETLGFGPTTFALEPSATINGVTYAHFHSGIDLSAPLGSTVRAAADGRVTFAGRNASGAVVVRILHGDGSETEYGHLQEWPPVSVGTVVHAGDPIGLVGMTGNTTGPHLHFSLVREGQAIDPAPWLQAGRLPGAVTAPPNADPAAATGLLDATSLASFDAASGHILFAGEIRQAAVDAGIDPLLLASLVGAESSFDPHSVSSAGAMGLTQLMPETARGLHVEDPFDPMQNLDGGARYLASNLRLYGRVDLALAAYQAGKGAVRAAGGIPDYPGTKAYIKRVLADWTTYREGTR